MYKFSLNLNLNLKYIVYIYFFVDYFRNIFRKDVSGVNAFKVLKSPEPKSIYLNSLGVGDKGNNSLKCTPYQPTSLHVIMRRNNKFIVEIE